MVDLVDILTITLSPWLTVRVAGAKPVALIWTVMLAATPLAASVRAAAVTASRPVMSFRIESSLRVHLSHSSYA